VETLGLVLLAGERLDHADLGDRLLENAHGLSLRVLRGPRDVADATAEVLADERDGRRHDEREQGEPPVHEEDDGDAARERQHLPEHLNDRLRDDPVDHGRVARHVRHELAGLASIEESERQRL